MARAMAFAKAIAERRLAGDRVGLLVVSVHGWDDGLWFSSSPEVCRVVLPADLAVDAADWSVCMALDVLLCGPAPSSVFYDAARAALSAGAVSCWGDFSEGIFRLEPAGQSLVAVDGPFPPNKLGAALRAHRHAALGLRLGGYASRVFDGARDALFGPLRAELSRSICEAGQ